MSYSYCHIYTETVDEQRKRLYSHVRIPRNFYRNAKGLLGEKVLSQNSGMLFKNCNSIHMLGMRMPLDIIFLSSDNTILKCINHLKPWRVAMCYRAKQTLELVAGSINQSGLEPDMKLEIEACSAPH